MGGGAGDEVKTLPGRMSSWGSSVQKPVRTLRLEAESALEPEAQRPTEAKSHKTTQSQLCKEPLSVRWSPPKQLPLAGGQVGGCSSPLLRWSQARPTLAEAGSHLPGPLPRGFRGFRSQSALSAALWEAG